MKWIFQQCVVVNLSDGFIVKFEAKSELMKLSDIIDERETQKS